ncbi:hypothetical protein [Massilia aquatica]|uniref:Response regulator transcription factor n=1 Tax=Massilia aquatica TaxID=2609000 RepID=A0ABX0LX66_9BURK|nr:hypothetical protein [Massilia aquatica]NHZ39117.1 hypothetical protein [Massilia aquatica]
MRVTGIGAPWVLLIDPDEEIAALLAALLAPVHRVAVAANAAAAGGLLAACAPRLIVADSAVDGVPALLAGGASLPPVLLLCGALPDLDTARRAELVLLKPGTSRRHLRLTLLGMLNACAYPETVGALRQAIRHPPVAVATGGQTLDGKAIAVPG